MALDETKRKELEELIDNPGVHPGLKVRKALQSRDLELIAKAYPHEFNRILEEFQANGNFEVLDNATTIAFYMDDESMISRLNDVIDSTGKIPEHVKQGYFNQGREIAERQKETNKRKSEQDPQFNENLYDYEMRLENNSIYSQAASFVPAIIEKRMDLFELTVNRVYETMRREYYPHLPEEPAIENVISAFYYFDNHSKFKIPIRSPHFMMMAALLATMEGDEDTEVKARKNVIGFYLFNEQEDEAKRYAELNGMSDFFNWATTENAQYYVQARNLVRGLQKMGYEDGEIPDLKED